MRNKDKLMNIYQRIIIGGLMVMPATLSLAQYPSEDLMPPAAIESVGNEEIDRMRTEREQFVKEIRRVENLNKKYTKEIEEIRAMLAEKDDDFKVRMKELEQKLSQQQDLKAKEEIIQEQDYQTMLALEEQTNQVLMNMMDADLNDEEFRQDLAKAHYNMGAIYVERGEYQRAVIEYFQAVDLMPNDPDIHYNLALVSGEYLGDQETALKHYQWYLYLNPNAQDAAEVRGKIMTAKMHLRAQINSPIDSKESHSNLLR